MAVSTRTDEQIQQDILEELKWDTRVQPNEIGGAVKDGIVTLTGWVDSYLKKMAAEEAAHRVPGVKAVKSHILWVEPMSGMSFPDPADEDGGRVADSPAPPVSPRDEKLAANG